jgi:outer membrane protein assembly factor BamB
MCSLALWLAGGCAFGDARGAGDERWVRWRRPVGTPDGIGWVGTPGTDGTAAFVETDSGMQSLDARTGAVRWDVGLYPTHLPAAFNVAVVGGAAYMAEPSAVYALDAATGRLRWRTALPGDDGRSFVAVDDRAVYAGAVDGRVVALAVADGHMVWTAPFGQAWQFGGRAIGFAVSGDTVFATGFHAFSESGHLKAGVVLALDRTTGRELWRFEAAGQASSAGDWPTLAGSRVLVGDFFGGSFFALDRATGRELWRVKGAIGHFGPATPPQVSGDTAFVASNDDNVYAVDVATGRILWRATTTASFSAGALCGRTFVANNQRIMLFDRESGHVLGSALANENETSVQSIPTSGFAVVGSTAIVVGSSEIVGLSCP